MSGLVGALAVLWLVLGSIGPSRPSSARLQQSRRTQTVSATLPGSAGRLRSRRGRGAHGPSTDRSAEIRRLTALGLPIYCGGHRGRDIALTFDDGPGPYTGLALRKLAQAHQRTTFFVVGRSIDAFPGYLRRELKLAAIGDHTENHLPLTALSPSEVAFQIQAAARKIQSGSGQLVDLFRPPYELHNPTVDAIAKRLGLLDILWNVDSGDSLGANYAQIVRNVEAGLHPGAIILLHENRGQTIRALTTLLPELRRRHLRSVAVPQLLAADPPSIAQARLGLAGCAVSRRPRAARTE